MNARTQSFPSEHCHEQHTVSISLPSSHFASWCHLKMPVLPHDVTVMHETRWPPSITHFLSISAIYVFIEGTFGWSPRSPWAFCQVFGYAGPYPRSCNKFLKGSVTILTQSTSINCVTAYQDQSSSITVCPLSESLWSVCIPSVLYFQHINLKSWPTAQ